MAMSSWLAPPPLPAVLAMVLLAFAPRRRRLLIPVGVTVWIDSRLSAGRPENHTLVRRE
jgi:hypothetical protein